MPQIDQAFAMFASQLLWLIVAFALVYFGIGRAMVPKIEGVVEQRDARIKGDLAEAEKARAEAEAADSVYQTRLSASRGEAQAASALAKQQAAAATEARTKAADAEIAARVAEAEARLNAQRAEAIAGLETVAAEAAQDIVARISGLSVDRDAAGRAVKAALSA